MLPNENRLFTATRLEGDVTEQWLDLRREGIGGSDVSAIMGISPWVSPVEVWMDKTGRVPHRDISGKEAVAMGTELEETVLGMYRRRHPERRATRCNAVLRSIQRPWAQASLDGVVRDPERGWGVLEIKTGSRDSEWAESVPDHYVAQVTHYMSVTGYRFADVVALIGDHGLHYHEYRLEWDDEDMEAVVSSVDEFWNEFVVKDVMPALVSTLPSEGKALYEIYRSSDGDLEPMESDEADNLAAEMSQLKQDYKDIGERLSECSNGLKRLIGEHKGIITTDHVVTWVRTEKRDMGVRVKVR